MVSLVMSGFILRGFLVFILVIVGLLCITIAK